MFNYSHVGTVGTSQVVRDFCPGDRVINHVGAPPYVLISNEHSLVIGFIQAKRGDPCTTFGDSMYSVSRDLRFAAIVVLPVDVAIIDCMVCIGCIFEIDGTLHSVAAASGKPACRGKGIRAVILKTIDHLVFNSC